MVSTQNLPLTAYLMMKIVHYPLKNWKKTKVQLWTKGPRHFNNTRKIDKKEGKIVIFASNMILYKEIPQYSTVTLSE